MKSAVKRVKGILLGLMYTALYPIIRFVTYFMYILYLKLGGRFSATEVEKSANENSFALSIVISVVSALIYLGVCKLRKKNISEYIQIRKAPLMIFIMAAIVAISARLMVEVYCTLIRNVEVFRKSIIESATVAPRLSTRLDFAIAFFSVLIAAPIFEEFLFRGLIMGELKKVMRPWAAILIQAVLFGISHGSLFQIPYTMLIGLLLGIIYHRTKTVIAPIICHSVYNFSATLMLSEISNRGNIVFMSVAVVLLALSMFYIIANTQTERKN